MDFGEICGFQSGIAEKVWRKWVDVKISLALKYTKECMIEVMIDLYV